MSLRCCLRALAIAAMPVIAELGGRPLPAQQAPSTPQAVPAPQIASYRPPALALVQPAAGGSVPQDRPVVVFRFAPGEPNDPIDARSFAVNVDGIDRTALFQVAASEAWGPLAPPDVGTLSLAVHQLRARICSARGACAELATTVAVVETAAGSAGRDVAPAERRRKVLEAVVSALRKLLEP